MKKIIFLITAMLILSAGNAVAMPLIDGNLSAGEWTTNLIINGWDPNEVGTPVLPDTHDIERLKMMRDSSGLYILVDLYGDPTWQSLGTGGNPPPVIYQVSIDTNMDADFSDALDRTFDFRIGGLVVYDGTGAVIADVGGPLAAMGFQPTQTNPVVEMFIPAAMLPSFNQFQTFAYLDNGGRPADDYSPDQGYYQTPEPGSIALLGLGLVGLIGSRLKRKKFTA